MKISFIETGQLSGSSVVRISLRSSAILNVQNNENYCFFWSTLASLHPCENDHHNRVSNYNQYFNESNIDAFYHTNEFKCTDMQRFEKLNNLSINIYEKIFLPKW